MSIIGISKKDNSPTLPPSHHHHHPSTHPSTHKFLISPNFKYIALSPKLFFVSTSTTTSTQTSSTFCFVATTASHVLIECKKRRKKRDLEAITTSGGQGQEWMDKIQPTPKQVCSSSSCCCTSFIHIFIKGTVGNMKEEKKEEVEAHRREGRLMNYWMTTTTTLISISYTATSTFASVTCTPAEFPYSMCG